MQTSELLKLGETFVDEGRFLPAVEVLREIRNHTKAPWYRLLATYNGGSVAWDKLGDGVAGRAAYLDLVGLEGPDYDGPQMGMIRANAFENLMLSALSYDEFYAFAERLRALAPHAPVLTGLPHTVEEIRQHGGPWTDVLFHLATVNYNRNDPARDRGRYGVARSTYHLILANRKSFRLSREDWRVVIYEFGALSMRMVADCMKMRGEPDPNPPEEYMGILTEAIPYFDEYLIAMSGDQSIRKLREQMATMIDRAHLRQHRGTIQTAPMHEQPLAPMAGNSSRCSQCHHLVESPLAPCPSCGTPTPIMFWVPMLSLAVAVAGGAFVAQSLSDYSTLVRGAGSAFAGLALLVLAGPLIMQLCLRWFRSNR